MEISGLSNLPKEVSELLNQVNRHEFLLGACESGNSLTSTQEHILMLLTKKEKFSQGKIAEALNISAAAVTKAVKVLLKQDFISTAKNAKDERVVELTLTEKGKPVAKEHATHHQKTLKVYENLLKDFSGSEQAVIERFVKKLLEVIQ